MGASIPGELTASAGHLQIAPSDRNVLADSPPVSEGGKPTARESKYSFCWDRKFREVIFSVAPSSEGGLDVKIGSDTIHAPKYFSAHHPLSEISSTTQLNTAHEEDAAYYDGRGDAENLPQSRYEYRLTNEKMCELSSEGIPWQQLLEEQDDTFNGGNHVCMIQLNAYGNLTVCQGTAGIDCKETVLAPASSLQEQNISLPNPGDSNGTTQITCSAVAHKDVHELAADAQPGSDRDGSGAGNFHPVEKTYTLDGEGRSTVTPGALVADPDGFLIDSGASVHATGNPAILSDLTLEQTGRAVRVASGQYLPIRGHGSVDFGGFILNDVKYVPGLTTNLISVSRLLGDQLDVGFTGTRGFIKKAGTDVVVGEAKLVNGLFKLERSPVSRGPA